jgi:hypothetical protein
MRCGEGSEYWGKCEIYISLLRCDDILPSGKTKLDMPHLDTQLEEISRNHKTYSKEAETFLTRSLDFQRGLYLCRKRKGGVLIKICVCSEG